MKQLRSYLLLLACCFSAILSQGQPNSVKLRDNNLVLLGSYSSIADAYAAIPSALTHGYIIEIMSYYNSSQETFPITFVEKTGASAANTITVTIQQGMNFGTIFSDDNTKPLILLDGADWINLGMSNGGWNSGLALMYSVPEQQQAMVEFINGACNNRLERLLFFGNQFDTTYSPAVKFGTSSATTGNSNNLVKHCSFLEGQLGILSEGSAATPNEGNFVTNCGFSTFSAVAVKAGTGNTYIADNQISVFGAYNELPVAAITLDSLSDTISISGNTINLQSAQQAQSVRLSAIEVRDALSGNHLVQIHNNVILSEINQWVYADTIITLADSMPKLTGIYFGGSTPVEAEVYFNTVRLHGLHGGGNSGDINSAALRRDGNAQGGNLRIMNNLFDNQRSGGAAGVHHVAMALLNTSGSLSVDYNVYTTAGASLVAYDGNTYNTIAGYQAAIGGGQEAHSNDVPLQFIDQFHLSAAMMGDPDLEGVSIATVGTDKEGDIRTLPYRGADEMTVSCTGVPDAGYMNKHNHGPCAEDSVYVSLQYYYFAGPSNTGGHVYQWQSRPLGSTTAFTDIPGASGLGILLKIRESTEFRMKDSCIAGTAQYVVDTIIYTSAPQVDSITATYNGLTLDFMAAGASNVLYYTWYFENGDTSNLLNPQYTFSGYNKVVKLVVSNDCGKDSVYFTVTAPNTVAETEAGRPQVYPNPVVEALTVICKESIAGLSVFDIRGRGYDVAIRTNGNTATVDVAGLPPGYYLLAITGLEGVVKYVRFMKN